MPSPLPRWGHRRGCCRSPKPVTAAFPIPLLGRLPHYAFRGLLGVHACYGLPARGVAQGDPFHRRLRQYRYLHCRSDCYRLERPLAGWELHPLKIDTFPRRTKGTHLISLPRESVWVFLGPTAGPNRGLQPQVFHHGLHPSVRTIRLASRHRPPQGNEFWFRLTLRNPLQPISRHRHRPRVQTPLGYLTARQAARQA